MVGSQPAQGESEMLPGGGEARAESGSLRQPSRNGQRREPLAQQERGGDSSSLWACGVRVGDDGESRCGLGAVGSQPGVVP